MKTNRETKSEQICICGANSWEVWNIWVDNYENYFSRGMCIKCEKCGKVLRIEMKPDVNIWIDEREVFEKIKLGDPSDY